MAGRAAAGRIQREEAAGDLPDTARRSADARPAVGAEGVQPVIDRDLLAGPDAAPGEDPDPAPHRVRLAGVIQVAAGWEKHGAALEVELTEMTTLVFGEILGFGPRDDATVPAAEDELARAKAASGEDAFPFGTGVSDDDVRQHAPQSRRGDRRTDSRRGSA